MILAACTAHAQQALTVIAQDYELARRTAQQEQKLLIVDFYTTWCIPCKMLDDAIFKNDSIAGRIGKDFVVLRYDAEKDSLHHLSLKHHVCSYPTTIVLTPEGRLIHKMFGTGGAKPLVENYASLLEESIRLHRQGKYIEGVSPAIDPGIYPLYYQNYVRRVADIKPRDLDSFWANNTDLQSEVSLAILAYFGNAPKPVTDYFVQHKPVYEQRFGKADVAFIMERITSEKFDAAIAAQDEARYKAAVKFAKKQLPPGDAGRYINMYSLEMHIAKGAWGEAAGLVEEQVRRKTIGEKGINYFCWTVYEQCNEQKVVGRAVHLMKNVTDANPSFALLDTYARLLFKNGNRREAITVMQQAIASGKANGEDTSESEEVLSRFQ